MKWLSIKLDSIFLKNTNEFIIINHLEVWKIIATESSTKSIASFETPPQCFRQLPSSLFTRFFLFPRYYRCNSSSLGRRNTYWQHFGTICFCSLILSYSDNQSKNYRTSLYLFDTFRKISSLPIQGIPLHFLWYFFVLMDCLIFSHIVISMKDTKN